MTNRVTESAINGYNVDVMKAFQTESDKPTKCDISINKMLALSKVH